jgi:hypothetical protein
MRRLKFILLFISMHLNLCLNALEPSISIDVLKGPEVIPYLQKVAQLRIEFYRNYPYLYEGNLTDEETYLSMYAKSKDSLLVIAKNGDDVVGAVTGIPMLETKKENKWLYTQKQTPDEHIFYLGELVLSQDYQNSTLQEMLYLQLENAVKGLEKYSILAVCEIERSPEALSLQRFFGQAEDLLNSLSYTRRMLGKMSATSRRVTTTYFFGIRLFKVYTVNISER